MFKTAQKDLSLSLLFDLYSPLLSEKKREIFDLYYNDDLSLSEVAEHTGTSRQAVRDLIARTGDELKGYEDALGLRGKQIALGEKVGRLKKILRDTEDTDDILREIEDIL